MDDLQHHALLETLDRIEQGLRHIANKMDRDFDVLSAIATALIEDRPEKG